MYYVDSFPTASKSYRKQTDDYVIFAPSGGRGVALSADCAVLHRALGSGGHMFVVSGAV